MVSLDDRSKHLFSGLGSTFALGLDTINTLGCGTRSRCGGKMELGEETMGSGRAGRTKFERLELSGGSPGKLVKYARSAPSPKNSLTHRTYRDLTACPYLPRYRDVSILQLATTPPRHTKETRDESHVQLDGVTLEPKSQLNTSQARAHSPDRVEPPSSCLRTVGLHLPRASVTSLPVNASQRHPKSIRVHTLPTNCWPTWQGSNIL